MDRTMNEQQEPTCFYPWDRYPQSRVPHPGWFRMLCCWLVRKCGGDHDWRRWFWGGVNDMFDCDMCYTCHMMKGPLPPDRKTKPFPMALRLW